MLFRITYTFFVGATLTCLATTFPASSLAEIVWIGVQKSSPSEHTAQRFGSAGSPDLVIGNDFNSTGRYHAFAAVGNTLYSTQSTGTSVARWNATTGAQLGNLTLDAPLSTHFSGGFTSRIGTSTLGELLFAPSGFSTEQRGIPKYSTDGSHLRTYTHPFVQHVHGTPTANADAMFVASRYNPGAGFVEGVLMFLEDGAFVDVFNVATSVLDVHVFGGSLYVLEAGSSMHVYDLNGTSLPTFSHSITLPTSASAVLLDEFVVANGALYIADDGNNRAVKVALDGTLLATYDVETRGTSNFIGGIAVVPEPSTWLLAVCGAGAISVFARRRRSPRRPATKGVTH